MHSKFIIIATVLASLSFGAWALDLDEARAKGLVGETNTGEVKALGATASPEVSALVKDINQKRLETYAEISKKNGQPVAIVQKLAAEKIQTKLNKGEHFQGADGAWAQK